MPRRFAWYATPCAWLLAEAAMTPRRRRCPVSDASVTSARRSLNEAVNCRFSNLIQISAPTSAESVRERRQGVSTTCPAMTSAAARMSFRVRLMIDVIAHGMPRFVAAGFLPSLFDDSFSDHEPIHGHYASELQSTRLRSSSVVAREGPRE